MEDAHRWVEGMHLGDVFTDVGLDIDHAVGLQQRDGGGHELFAGRRDVEDGFGSVGDLVFDAGLPEGVVEDHLAVLQDGEHTTRRSAVEAGGEGLDLVGGVGHRTIQEAHGSR